MRKLTEDEYRALVQFAQRLDTRQKDQLLADLKDCLVHEETVNGSRLIFHIPHYQRPIYHGQHTYPVEGAMNDCDGKEISVLLHADENDRILEMELIKWDTENSQALKPDWTTLRSRY